MTPEDQAKKIDLGHDHCCHRATGGTCYEHQAIAAAIRAAAAEEREACAQVCEGIYRQYGEAVRECDTPEGHERLKNRAGGAGECAAAVRARGK